MKICNMDCFHCIHADCINNNPPTDAEMAYMEYIDREIIDKEIVGVSDQYLDTNTYNKKDVESKRRAKERYYKEHREEKLAYCKDYYEKHKEEKKRKAREYYKKHKERIKQRNLERKIKNDIKRAEN